MPEPIDSDAVDIVQLRKQLMELNDAISQYQDLIKPLQNVKSTADARKHDAYMAYLKIQQEIDDEAMGVNSKIVNFQREINKAREQASTIESAMKQAISIREADNNFKVLEDRWNDLTKDAPWREFVMAHQDTASDKMVFYRKVGLFDVMGTGKTMSAIITCDKIKAATTDGDTWYDPKVDAIGRVIGTIRHDAPPAGRHILYLCPAELVRNVEPEWKKWAPYRSPKILAKRTKLQREILLEAIADIKEEGNDTLVLVNYEAWRKDEAFLDNLIKLNFDTVIMDEAHVLKDRETNAYRGVSRILSGHSKDGIKLGDPVRFVFPMTGTPFLNKPQELYSILTLIEPKIFSNTSWGEHSFLTTYCDQEDNKWFFRPGGLESLAKKISNRFIRRTLKDAGIVLPPQTIQYHELEIAEDLYPLQAKARQEMTEKASYIIDVDRGHAIVAPIMLTVYLRLRQIETWPAGVKLKDGEGNVVCEIDVYESQKMDYILDNKGDGLLSEICPDQRTVVFSQFKEPLKVLAERATKAGMRTVILDGSTSQEIRNEIKIDFDRTRCTENGREPKWDVLFANYKVGGVGLNLTDATQIIAMDEEWSPGKEDQAFGRVNRIGQTMETGVHIIRMSKTVDSWLAGIIEEKRNQVTNLNDAMGREQFLEARKRGDIV